MESETHKEQENWEKLTRVERLGEMLVRINALKLSQLTDLMQEQERTGKRLGELAVEKGFITQDALVDYLIAQIRGSQSVDDSLRELGRMTNEEKWERLSQHERLGEILIKRQVIRLSQLVEAIEFQKEHPEKHLGEVLTEKGLISEEDLNEALKMQFQQNETLRHTLEEVQTPHHHPGEKH
ncbi:hypothetical protein COW36_05430 [bacterium (Candidatus Blackallbacteria) CG17_big_fil_post_rev_8_21_14_2_50_48_46]|uniref:Type II secretion system protein GspE N-terminal domain-containing protein n=1 Tax=bacterium (Candidatus Blackallbacteria) CG17_big_fil_post_rev_8_21_14_2_50_48_46 TaxID=2014261 RepID=A0A2M7G7Z8_9BACT|nr:MAG: hypothetical protein COW64_21025 [bacterium (Candidatus Blackallbacteria) CG18_big_fil_WC_8_21_14_2_50_49_26]PIW18210.1 MAG: hypothetical protein COW36_05430 [bacterium (Candidatus Blackallbacteria) CG17_big_fil_post_rev_8_21_14_2_50_48_46]PIW50641.1 MAG: hypothetical protein COW20_01695 [bacterium (Candidatus Blackallbacteria) CG13_big_fil_rev_8_21_14_2_50_49_14]